MVYIEVKEYLPNNYTKNWKTYEAFSQDCVLFCQHYKATEEQICWGHRKTTILIRSSRKRLTCLGLPLFKTEKFTPDTSIKCSWLEVKSLPSIMMEQISLNFPFNRHICQIQNQTIKADEKNKKEPRFSWKNSTSSWPPFNCYSTYSRTCPEWNMSSCGYKDRTFFLRVTEKWDQHKCKFFFHLNQTLHVEYCMCCCDTTFWSRENAVIHFNLTPSIFIPISEKRSWLIGHENNGAEKKVPHWHQ